MSKKKKNKQRDRQKRQQKKQKNQAGRRQADRQRSQRVAERAAASSLEGMKRAPMPEVLPAIILAVGSSIPVLTVRFYPAWPAWWHLVAFVCALVVFTYAAHKAAKRRPPKWDPLLFFGVSAFAAAVSWSGDAGEIWVLNSSGKDVRWHVDGGLETELVAGGRARLDLRRGQHKLQSADQIVDFALERGERLAIVVGTRNCVSMAGIQRRESMFRIGAAEPAPDVCPPSKSTAPVVVVEPEAGEPVEEGPAPTGPAGAP